MLLYFKIYVAGYYVYFRRRQKFSSRSNSLIIRQNFLHKELYLLINVNKIMYFG